MRFFAVAVDLGGTAIKSGLVDAGGRILAQRERPTDRNASSSYLLELVACEIAALLVHAQEQRLAVAGIGLATPGLADARGRIVGGCPNIPGWKGIEAGPRLARRFTLPVAVGNDANLAALGEQVFGAGRGARSLVLLTLGTGIGGGIVVDGKLFTGGRGLGTELGHMTIDRNGPACPCGGRGCLELYSSATAILKTYNKSPVPGPRSPASDVREVFMRAGRGDRRARRAVEQALETLGLAVAGLLNAFNPDVFILGGGMSRIPSVVRHVRRAARARAIDVCQKGVRIVPARLGNDAGLAGAAALIFRKLC